MNLNKYGSFEKKKSALVKITSHETEDLPELKMGSRGEAVEILQRLLFIKIDGIFGPKTSKSVKTFKRSQDLGTNDVVKSYVWKLLMDYGRIDH